MERWVRVCTTWEEEAEADREFWLRFSPEERVAIVDTLKEQWTAMTGKMKPNVNQSDFLACLGRHGVRALLIGGHAVAFHAKPHYTAEMDLFVEPSVENLQRIGAAVSDSDIPVPGEEPDRINISTSIAGVSFPDAWRNRMESSYAGQPVAFIGREDLIRHKEATGHLRDLADADLLRRFL